MEFVASERLCRVFFDVDRSFSKSRLDDAALATSVEAAKPDRAMPRGLIWQKLRSAVVDGWALPKPLPYQVLKLNF